MTDRDASGAGTTRRVCVLLEDCDVRVHRPGKWGNPFRIGPDGNREAVIRRYREHILSTPHLMKQLPRLKGKRLGCFCKPGELCHGDVLVDLTEQLGKTGRLPKPSGFFRRQG